MNIQIGDYRKGFLRNGDFYRFRVEEICTEVDAGVGAYVLVSDSVERRKVFLSWVEGQTVRDTIVDEIDVLCHI